MTLFLSPTRSAGAFNNVFSAFRSQSFAASAARSRLREDATGANVSGSSDEDVFQKIRYGLVRTGGLKTFMATDVDGVGEFLHVFFTIAAHEIEEFVGLYLDDELVTFPGALTTGQWANGDWLNFVFFSPQFGTDSQAANPDLVSQSAILFPGQWTAEHRQRGHAGFYCIFKFDRERFPYGAPKVRMQYKGKNDIYDPRGPSTGYTNNAALCIADYITDTRHGLGGAIDDTNLIEAANICDEQVAVAAGGNENRYEINGSISSAEPPSAVIPRLAASIAGDIVFSQGIWRIYPGEARTAGTTLTEDNLRGPIQIKTNVSRRDNFNRIGGIYTARDKEYDVSDFPPIQNTLYESEDGKVIAEDIDLRLVSSPSQAQRIAKIELERIRQGIVVQGSFDASALQYGVADIVPITSERLGWTDKEFEVRDRRIITLGDGDGGSGSIGAALVLKEHAAGIYDWNSGEETTIDLAPNTSLPDPSSVPDITGLTLASGTAQLDIRADGTIFSRIRADWDTISNPFHKQVDIQYKKSSETEWIAATPVPRGVDFTFILDVQDSVNYDVRARGVNELGNAGNWTNSLFHLVVGKTEPPSDVQNFTVSLTSTDVLLSWDQISDLDLSYYEVREGTDFATGVSVGKPKSDNLLTIQRTAGTHNFHIKAVDTSGNFSSNEASASLVIDGPGAVQSLTADTVANFVELRWSAPLTGSLPIDRYDVYKGDTFGTATLIGEVRGTFSNPFELIGGTFTYWVVPVDTAGNAGPETGVMANVDDPRDFVLVDSAGFDSGDWSFVDAMLDEQDRLIGPVDINETITDHYTGNGWNTRQDQITAGFPLYIQPTTSYGSATATRDYGAILPATSINLEFIETFISGSLNVTHRILTSADDVIYTDHGSVLSVFTSGFRYVRIIFEWGTAPAGGGDNLFGDGIFAPELFGEGVLAI